MNLKHAVGGGHLLRISTRYVSRIAGSAMLIMMATFAMGANGVDASVQRRGSAANALHSGVLSKSFYNPIMDGNADPFMMKWEGSYILTATTGSNVTLWQSSSITNIAAGSQAIVWSPSGAQSNLTDIWSPELYRFGGHWYIYFAADVQGNNATHRDYVLESNTSNPLGSYRFVGEVHDPANQWMIDPNILDLHGKLYFLWSGWLNPRNQVQRLFIAPMRSPTEISGSGVVISSPTYAWEKSVAPINEGPVSLQHGGKTFIIYSANASWKNGYNLGMLTLRGSNPLNPRDWVKNPAPVFSSANGVYGPGRASFVVSENGKQNWMIYHAARYDQSGWDRTIRAQPFTWNKNGTPDFGKPDPLGTALALPQGEKPNRVTYVPVKQKKTTAIFRVHVASAGTYGMFVRYRNITGASTMQNLVINGQPQLPLSFPQTDKTQPLANQYSVLEMDVTLPKGNSSIEIYEGPLAASVSFIQLTTKKR